MTNGKDSINPIRRPLDILNPDQNGLSKREYFAAQALSSLAKFEDDDRMIQSSADVAVKYADALIKSLNQIQ